MNSESMHSPVDLVTAERIGDAPLPTRRTLAMRQNLVFQAWRFARINLKMMRIVLRGHH